jgi:hypothetical protein
MIFYRIFRKLKVLEIIAVNKNKYYLLLNNCDHIEIKKKWMIFKIK